MILWLTYKVGYWKKSAMHLVFSPSAFQVFVWDLAGLLRKCHSLQQKREHTETPHPPSLTPALAPSIPQANFPAMWLALTNGVELNGNSTPYHFHTCISSCLLRCRVYSISAETLVFHYQTSAAHSVGHVLRVCLNYCTALSYFSSSPQYWQKCWSGKLHFFPINLKSV